MTATRSSWLSIRLLLVSGLMASALGAETATPAGPPAAGPSATSIRIAASQFWERIAQAHDVRVRRLTGEVIDWSVGTIARTDAPIAHTPSLATGALYPLLDERLMPLDHAQVEALHQALAKRRTAGLLDIQPECTFEPGVAFCCYGPIKLGGNLFESTSANEPSVVLVVCFKCDEMRVVGPAAIGQSFDIINAGARKVLLQAALSAFPQDAALLAMSRDEK